MESQNHFYGHSAALAAYLGRRRPRHIPGLVQHGWTAVSPVGTHFRDFPQVGLGTDRRRLLVWSHTSRAWDPAAERHRTTPIGAQFAYLARAAGAPPTARDERDAVVLMPVHGIQTQRVRGDHAGLARLWRDQEGPATVCLYASDAQDAQIAGAYRDAGHRLVILGDRMDPDFLWRLWTMVGRARRVVSNRLSTPVVYAAHLGADIGVYGDTLQIDGEGTEAYDHVRALWPELHAEHVDPEAAAAFSRAELGVDHLLEPAELADVLGWDSRSFGPAVEYWSLSPARRAVVNLRRRSQTQPAPAPAGEAPTSLGFAQWFVAALSYLPRPLPRAVAAAGEVREPITVG